MIIKKILSNYLNKFKPGVKFYYSRYLNTGEKILDFEILTCGDDSVPEFNSLYKIWYISAITSKLVTTKILIYSEDDNIICKPQDSIKFIKSKI